MQIRRSAVVCLLQDSMILSYQVNCTGTHLRGRTLLIRWDPLPRARGRRPLRIMQDQRSTALFIAAPNPLYGYVAALDIRRARKQTRHYSRGSGSPPSRPAARARTCPSPSSSPRPSKT